MRCFFMGVGEAFDPLLPNTCVLVQAKTAGERCNILLDCGYTAAASYWKLAPDPMDLQAVWISHFHGDHYFGLSHLFLRFHEEGRTEPLTIISQPGIQERVETCMDLAYANLRIKKPYALQHLLVQPGKALAFKGLRLLCAQSEHPQTNYALRLEDQDAALLYSGDGRPTEASRELACGVDLLIHESFSLEEDTPGHGTVPGTLELARQAQAKRVALLHLRRDVRHGRKAEVDQLLAENQDLNPMLPMPGDIVDC